MKFIAFEGVDGSGKSTLLSNFAKSLDGLVPYRVTREPGGTPLAEEIRRLLLQTDGEAPVPRAELLLYQAGRAQHVEKVIRPALKQGQWVLCDRFYASTLAFQCGGRSLDQEPVQWLNNFAVDGCHPDLWVLVDLEVQESIKRRSGRAHEDRFEQEQQEFHQRVRDHYLQLSQRQPDKWLVLDGRNSPEDLLKHLRGHLAMVKKWLK